MSSYYEKLYKKNTCDEEMQNYFLHFIDKKLNDYDNEIFHKDIRETIFSSANNKCPGIDGIPIEFYKIFWDDIKHELKLVLENMVLIETLSNSQITALITLISKVFG